MFNSKITSNQELDQKIANCYQKIEHFIVSNKVEQKCCLGTTLHSERNPDGVRFLGKKWRTVMGIILILHYTRENIFSYIIRAEFEVWLENEPNWYWCLALLANKENFLTYLIKQQQMSEKQFFSSICCKDQIVSSLHSIQFLFERFRTPQRTVRRRGYRDKGTLPPLDERIRRKILLEAPELTLDQSDLEERKNERKSEVLLLSRYLSEGQELSDELRSKFRLERRCKDERYPQKED